MNVNARGLLILASWVLSVGVATAQLPAPPVPVPAPSGGGGARLPDDQIEGTIFEYKATLKPSAKAGEEVPTLEGKFRIEDSAVFDVSPTVKVPSAAEVEKAGEKLAAGKGGEVKLPAPPQQKRLGQYHRISSGRIRLDLNDKDSLHGIMILQRQKNTDDVWFGTYTEKDGNKTGRVWQVEVRPIED